jgi:hypothetical protein
MRPNRWKGWILAGSLIVAGGISTTPVPARACVFVQQFHKLSETRSEAGIWERVVYSLIEASQSTTNRSAPNSSTTGGVA